MFVLNKKYFGKYDIFFSTKKTIFHEINCFQSHFCYDDIDNFQHVAMYSFASKNMVII